MPSSVIFRPSVVQRAWAFALGMLVAGAAAAGQTPPSQAGGLRIVVIEGENAVNIIQQKTAVAPVIEIRDRNDLPVSGAAVTFAIGGNNATFAGGVQTLTVTTNAAGRAAVSALNPLSGGAFQINVQAAFQGQTAVATIAQTNVLTAAETATATGSGAASGGTAGGGGGLSNTATASIVGGAGAGAAVAALAVAGGDSPAAPAPAPTPAPARSYTGPFSVPLTWTFGSLPPVGNGCTRTELYSGTLEMDLTPASDGGIRGTAMVRATSIVTAVTCSGGPQLGTTETHGIAGAMVMGTTGSFGFDMSRSNTFPGDGTSPGGVTTQRWAFTGALNADVVMGTLTFTRTIVDNPASISTSLSITLR